VQDFTTVQYRKKIRTDRPLAYAHQPHLSRARHRASPYQAQPSVDQYQVEPMDRTLKEATVRRYHYETHRQLREHLGALLDAYNFAKRLKTLCGLTPFEAICKAWAGEPHRFRRDPIHLTAGLKTPSPIISVA
jgi:hypothetical protein